jgi:hypothetical protein
VVQHLTTIPPDSMMAANCWQAILNRRTEDAG